MKTIHCPKDIGLINTFDNEDCEREQFYNDCYHCWTSAIVNYKNKNRPQGEWTTKIVKKFCPPDCWWPDIFAIEDSWDEKEGSWLEEQDGFCSECGKQDKHHDGHKYCPYCGSYNGGDRND